MANKVWIVIGALCGLAVICLLVSKVLPAFWPDANCEYWDIDLNSGRVRDRQYLLGLHVGTDIRETCISRGINATSENEHRADWRVAHRYIPIPRCWRKPLSREEHSYLGARFERNMVEQLYRGHEFTPGARKQVAETFLRLLQEDRNTDRLELYTESLSELTFERANADGKPITVSGLPAPQARER